MTPRTRIGEIVPVEAGDVHVRQDGPADGHPIVLVHGFASSLHWFDLLTPLLADTCRVIRVDLQGHGCTGGRTGLDAASQGRMVASVLDALGLTGVTAVGHSFGADVCVAMAEQGDRVDRLVLVGQAPDLDTATFPRGNTLLTLPGLGPLLHRLSFPQVMRRAIRVAFAPGFDPATAFDHRDRAHTDHAAMSPRMYRTALVERKHVLAARPLDTQVRELSLPTLAIAGRHDRFFDCESSIARYRAVGAQAAVIEHAGHSPMLERPHHVAQLINDFHFDESITAREGDLT